MASAASLDPERRLALAYVPAARRAAVEALWQLDVAFAAVIAAGREPMITQIKLAWWRQALERLDEAPPPAEPVLEALAKDVLPQRISGSSLAEMERGWGVLLAQEILGAEDVGTYAAGRGALLFRISALLLGAGSGPEVEAGGEAWALVDLARKSSNEGEQRTALALASERGGELQAYRWPVQLRPLGMLAALAARDAARGTPEAEASPRRVLRMMRHRLTGR